MGEAQQAEMMNEANPQHILKALFGFTDSMVLKCAVKLGIPDILHSNNGHPMTLSEIASRIDSSHPLNMSYLLRIMRMLVRMKIFTSTKSPSVSDGDDDDDGGLVYGATPSSMVLLRDADMSLAPLLLMENHPKTQAAWHYLSDCVREGGSGFKKAHGCELFEMAANDPELNEVFNQAMRSSGKVFAKAILTAYRDGFSSESGVESVVDVGGSMGHLIADIVREFPHIKKGINFDLPHVVAMAPEYEGVTHVPGDMFKDDIPPADAIFLKHILHDWGDEDCVKILKNCRKSIISNKKGSGKMIIVDMVLREEGEKDDQGFLGNNIDVTMDLVMMALHPGAKERTRLQWKKILEEAGFPRHNIIHLPFMASVIEAFPQ